MSIEIASRRLPIGSVSVRWPEATVVDVTSKGPEPWVRFSPFFAHGGIPIPHTFGQTAQSVEGLWQGLKVFTQEDVDPRKWAITNRSGIKRGGRSRGPVRGHRFGVCSETLLDYRDARYRIYLPAYLWVLEHRLACEVELLRELVRCKPLVLLDFETNADVDDLSRPLSHAALVRHYLSGTWPAAAATCCVQRMGDIGIVTEDLDAINRLGN